MTAARDELRRLVEQHPEDQVSTALLDLQRLATEPTDAVWPPEWSGSITAGRPDTSESVSTTSSPDGFGR